MKRLIAFATLLIFCLLTKQTHAQSKPRFNHLTVYVTDLARASKFYTDVMMLDTIPEPFQDGRHTWFKLTEHGHLHIISGNKKDQPHIKDTHICFSVPSVEDFIKKLNAEKIPFESWKGEKQQFTLRVDGVKQVYFQDPDGFWVEVNDAKD